LRSWEVLQDIVMHKARKGVAYELSGPPFSYEQLRTTRIDFTLSVV
jgi:hypothetical protein